MVVARTLDAPAPCPIEILSLGRFEVRVDGTPLRFERKTPRRPLALLKALIAAGGREVAETALMDALWPEADGDAASAALATTLHRLRRLVRYSAAVIRRDGRVGLDGTLCQVDCWRLEDLLADGEAALARSSEAPRRLVSEAVALYRGPFLPGDVDDAWATALRERLRARLLRLLSTVGRLHEQAGRWEEAAACYERGLDLDDGAEGLCRRAMGAYARLARPAEGLALYERCRRQLGAALGVAPSAETEALHRELRRLAATVGRAA